MKIGIVKESYPGERRVALVPSVLPSLTKKKIEVLFEPGAGVEAGYPDEGYVHAGARLAPDRKAVFDAADVVLYVRGPSANPERGDLDLALVRPGQILVGLLDPLGTPARLQRLAERGVTAFALELLPRITRAQSMDVLSSMANIAGYKAVLLAAVQAPRMFPMMMTAAGTVSPAKVLVLGAGVAGLQAIATAKRMGALVEAYDVRPAVREQVQSVGGRFIDLGLETQDVADKSGYAKAQSAEFIARQQAALAEHLRSADVVITTAQVPGRRAPVLITAAMQKGMKPGSIIVDLAAEQGGNCALTRPGETVEVDGVSILGPVNLPSSVPFHASQLYAKNVSTFLLALVDEAGALTIVLEDEIVRETLVARDGAIVHPRVREALTAAGPIA